MDSHGPRYLPQLGAVGKSRANSEHPGPSPTISRSRMSAAASEASVEAIFLQQGVDEPVPVDREPLPLPWALLLDGVPEQLQIRGDVPLQVPDQIEPVAALDIRAAEQGVQLAAGCADPLPRAGRILRPSYISLESALSAHGWIPERVVSTTSTMASDLVRRLSPDPLWVSYLFPRSIHAAMSSITVFATCPGRRYSSGRLGPSPSTKW